MALTLAGLACGTARAGDPKVPPAVETGTRVPLALLTTGFDYTRPEIATRLARDGEGEIIAWDIPGNDRFPYAAGEAETALVTDLASRLRADAPLSLLPVRVDPADPGSLAKALAFIARTPARTVLVPMWSSQRSDWELFAAAARHFAELRFAVRACPDLPPGGTTAVFPRDLNLPAAAPAPAAPGAGPAAELMAYVADLPCRRP